MANGDIGDEVVDEDGVHVGCKAKVERKPKRTRKRVLALKCAALLPAQRKKRSSILGPKHQDPMSPTRRRTSGP